MNVEKCKELLKHAKALEAINPSWQVVSEGFWHFTRDRFTDYLEMAVEDWRRVMELQSNIINDNWRYSKHFELLLEYYGDLKESGSILTHSCQATNIGFNSIKMACKTCGKDMV